MIGAGAKILGPIMVGDGAKVGSNAVVVKRRAARRDRGRHSGAHRARRRRRARREAQAAKIGFSAYAISADMNDPMVQAIHQLLDHAAATDERLNELIAQLQQRAVSTAATPRRRPSGFDPERDQPDA